MKNKLLIILLALAVFVPFVFSNWGLTESSEARYAEISREMYTGGDYLHPKLLGIQHFHKPPVAYYITALGYSIFGVNEYGARFFLQIALLLQVILVFAIAQLLFKSRNLSLAAALIYFSYPVVQIAAKDLTTDAYLTAFIFAGIYCFIRYHAPDRKYIYLYLFYILSALAFLTKGPVAVMPQFIFAVCYMRVMKIRFRFSAHWLAGLILFLLLSASWFVALLAENKDFYHYFFYYQLVSRVSGDVFHRSQPFWYYFLMMPLMALPAFIYFIGYVVRAVRTKKISSPLVKILSIPLILMFIVFSASSSKLILYVLPLYLFIAILSAKYLTALSPKCSKAFDQWSLIFAVIVFTAAGAAHFFTTGFNVPLLLVPMCAAGIIIMFLIYRKPVVQAGFLKAPVLNGITIAWLVLLLPFLMKANETAVNSVKPVAEYININAKGAVTNVSVYDYLLPSLAFYTRQNIITLDNGYHIAARETYFEKTNDHKGYGYIRIFDTTARQKLHDILSDTTGFTVAREGDLPPDSLSALRKTGRLHIIDNRWYIFH